MPTLYFARQRGSRASSFNDVFALDTVTSALVQISVNPRGTPAAYYDTLDYRVNAAGTLATYLDTYESEAEWAGLYETVAPPVTQPRQYALPGCDLDSAVLCDQDQTIACAAVDQLITVNRATRAVTTLRSGPGLYFYIASSPDGQWLAYIYQPTPGSSHGDVTELCICAPDGTQHRTLSQPGVVGMYGSPSWSPDGTEIAYGLTIAGQTSLNIVRVSDNVHRTVMAPAAPFLTCPLWVPGGIYLTIAEAVGVRGAVFFRADPTGVLTQITFPPPAEVGWDRASSYWAS